MGARQRQCRIGRSQVASLAANENLMFLLLLVDSHLMPLRPTKGECKGATDITKAFWAFYECPIHNWKGPYIEVTHYKITGIESLVTR